MTKDTYLVIVESPAKSKTIQKYLGKQYDIKASYGHVRDLPKGRLGIDVEDSFQPTYSSMRDKSKVLSELKKAAKLAKYVYLATDPDREGEAIAWHIVEALGLPKEKVKRIVFNEITQTAILNSIKSPISINQELVDAQQARRILDRLIGYKLSPILSKKIRRGLSAGRVQSVTVRLICDREATIQAFLPEEYWVLSPDFKIPIQPEPITCQVFAKDDPKTKLDISSQKEADLIDSALNQSCHSVKSISRRQQKRSSRPAFITSTLQQDAANKLGWTTKRTMIIAQQLYEGIQTGGELTGLITYMRTDSIRVSDEAQMAGRAYLKQTFGDTYLGTSSKNIKKKGNVQDAHEAIRPSLIDMHPDKLESDLSTEQWKLYTLIWERFMASLMAPSQTETTTVIIESSATDRYYSKIAGTVTLFPGYTAIFSDQDKFQDKGLTFLHHIKEKDELEMLGLAKDQKFTKPPARYTEASLVKELEDKGIGRPSTYSPTISTILDRGYVDKEDRSLRPTELGGIVNTQLEQHFSRIVDYQFTAEMEVKLDEIMEGKHSWKDVVSEFYSPFEALLKDADERMERIKYGERVLGIDPKTNHKIFTKIGKYGPYIQLGDPEILGEDEKPKFASLLPDQSIDEITLDDALKLFDLPRIVGSYGDIEVSIKIGRFGPYIQHGKIFVSISADQIFQLSLDESIILVQEQIKKKEAATIACFDHKGDDVMVLEGRYGPYIKHKKKNAKIPKNVDPKTLDLEMCLKLLAKKKTKPKRK